MNRIKEFKAVLLHKMAFLIVMANNQYLREKISLRRALLHDTGKALNILLLGDRIATAIHRRMAGHHQEQKMTFVQKVEAFCDWECARYTKPEKPLNGAQTWVKYYAHVDMGDIVDAYYDAEPTNKEGRK